MAVSGPPWAPETGPELEQVRHYMLLSQVELWIRCVGLGGAASFEALRRYLAGERRASRAEHNLIVHAMNEHFSDTGRDRPVGYRDEPATA